MLPILQIGPAALPTRPILILIALYVMLWWAEKEGAARGVDGEALWNAGFIGAAAGLVGGRLAYVAAHWGAYRSDLGAILSLTPGTISSGWGLLIGVGAALLYLRRKGLLHASTGAALAPGAAAGLALVSIANFLSGDAYGIPTELPWGIPIWDARRHPVQLYEAVTLLATLIAIYATRHRVPEGRRIWLVVLGYGLSRWLWDPFRASSWTVAGGLRGPQVLGLAAMLVAVWLIMRPPSAVGSGLTPAASEDEALP